MRSFVRSQFVPLGLVFLALAGCLLDPEGDNSPPAIESLTISRDVVYPDSVSIVAAVAIDRDGDHLGYRWESTAGIFPENAAGDTVFWQAPDSAAVCTLTVIVTDGDDTVRGSMTVEIPSLPRPEIVIDTCPTRGGVGGGEVEFHGKFGDLGPSEFFYSWTLLCDIDGPVCVPWTEWTQGVTQVTYWDLVPMATYTFEVKCAVQWGNGLLESARYAQCRFSIRTLHKS